jgi:DNA gyrase/topoisomerase IV subunit B
MTKKTIEETYQMMTQHEHVLKRPDTYIGSIVKQKQTEWVFKKDKIKQKEVEYVPGFLKIVDEAITNALDHSQRHSDVTTIKVDVSEETGEISVMNNGPGIPIVIHSSTNLYVPEMIFGNLLTSSNYDDTEQRTGAGRNGLGVTCTAIFSKSFKIETVDSSVSKKYIQTFTENMTIKSKPKITDCSQKSYTKVTFLPDYEKFNMEGLDKSTFSLLKRRVYECIACTNKNVSIYFNGEKLKGKGLLDYASYFTESVPLAYEINGDWEYLVYQNQGYEQVSFVNGNHTSGGGKHVDFIVNQIVSGMKEKLEKKLKDQNVKANTIKDNLFIFVKCVIVNPKFTSQTKDVLSTPSKDFGNQIKVSEAFINKIYKSGITQEILEVVAFKNRKLLDKNVSVTKKSRISVKNLDDATNAGTSKSSQTTLLLTEGLSASSFAISGLSVVGRANYGVFALRGKLLNIREATQSQLLKNEEIIALKKIMGLSSSKTYETKEEIASLRYGSIGLLTDADCVTGDTPLLLKDENDNILTETIERLTNDYIKNETNGKEYGSSRLKVWTEKGWVGIKCIMRHKVSKNFYRVLSHTGLVDVSEDHPLLTEDGNEKHTIDCSIGEKLLHSFPTFCENKINIPNNLEFVNIRDLWEYCKKCKIPYYQSYKKSEIIKILMKIRDFPSFGLKCSNVINEEEAYVMGLFWADGTSGIYNWTNPRKSRNGEKTYIMNRTSYNWSITNGDLVFLEKAKSIIEKIYNYEFKIIECDVSRNKNSKNRSYRLMINGGKTTKYIIDKYTDMFYYYNTGKYKKGNKYIPKEILNASRKIRENFLEGFYNGDGYHHNINGKSLNFDIESKISAQSLFILCKSLGYLVSMNVYENKPNIINFNITKGTQQFDSKKIKKIIKLGRIDDYVYDLETENHHFQAGVGQMIIHNCDGVHIASLIMNFIHFWWPALMKIKGFIKTIRTPIVKLKSGNVVKKFYNEIDYKAFMETSNTKWVSKYYKGLGTSTALEAKETFKELAVNTEIYIDDKNVNKSFNLAFNKKQANDRKTWLKKIPVDHAPRNERNEITYSDFINKELIHFSVYDNIRSIPNIMDGLKPSQRKVLYTAFKRNLKKEIKVAQFGASVAEETAYHHGEVSLSMTIIGMAQDYPGSNNINLLEPCGNFGYRNHNGKDSASPRYIFTHLTKSAQDLFIKEDEQILEYNEDDGVKIEPKFYVPTLPMVLINGVIGIGTGYSTNIPSYNPDDIRKNIHLLLNGKEMIDLVPWVKGFKGTITRSTETSFIMKGLLSKSRDNVLVVDEIPTNISISDYKDFLETFEEFSVKNESTENTPKFTLVFKNVEDVKKFNHTTLKLTSKINTSNMHLFTVSGELKKYDNPNEIIREFVKCKLEYLQKRKLNLIKGYKETLLFLKNKKRFLECIINESINVYKKTKMEIERSLVANKFDKIKESFSYLTSLPISSFTSENLDELEKSIKKYEELYKIDYNKSPVDFFKLDLNK